MPREKDFDITVRVRNNHLLERRTALGVSQEVLAQAVGVSLYDYGTLEGMRESPFEKPRRSPTTCVVPGCEHFHCGPQKRYLCRDHLDVPNEQAIVFRRAAAKRHEPTIVVWREAALKIAEYFDVAPEELWPDAVVAVKIPVVSRKAYAEEIAGMVAGAQSPRALLPEVTAGGGYLEEQVLKHLADLTPREQMVLRMRFGIDEKACTLSEVAVIGGASGQAVSRDRVRQVEAKALRKMRRIMPKMPVDE